MDPLTPLLLDSQVEEYEQQGYLRVSQLLSDHHLNAIANELDAFQRGEKEVGIVPYAKSLDADPGFKKMSLMCWLAEVSEPLRAVLHHPTILAMVTQLLGPSVRWWWDQGVVKNPVSGSTFPWHQDDAYESTDPPRSLNAILSIDSTTQENGCLWVIPGSHHGPLHEHWTEPGEWHRRCYNGDNPGIPLESALGDIIFLHCRTIHCSHENRSESRRRTYQAAYCDADARSQITGQPYNDKPLLLEDGQPTDIVRDTWTHLGYHIEH